jgi:hypothetical protein
MTTAIAARDDEGFPELKRSYFEWANGVIGAWGDPISASRRI